ncbi:serine O-acetyltransferase [Glutamicibacter protophormiae]|uniref:serine O-acetyltransferase n=1 Tax=Glutamicibacter protophormiae TaxID=37930 RepID=UPI003323952E
MNLLAQLKEDLYVNAGQPKGQLAVLAYRIAHASRKPLDKRPRLWAIPIGLAYRLLVEWILGIEIPWGTKIGRRLRIYHGVGIVINDRTLLGNDVHLRQGVTIGNSGHNLQCPVIEDGVNIGASAVLLGGITVGRHSTVAAGALVTKDVPAGGQAKGNPAVIKEPRDTSASEGGLDESRTGRE